MKATQPHAHALHSLLSDVSSTLVVEKLPRGLDAEPPQQLGGGGGKKKKQKHQALPVGAPVPEDGGASWKYWNK